jgi:hypothetical protein
LTSDNWETLCTDCTTETFSRTFDFTIDYQGFVSDVGEVGAQSSDGIRFGTTMGVNCQLYRNANRVFTATKISVLIQTDIQYGLDVDACGATSAPSNALWLNDGSNSVMYRLEYGYTGGWVTKESVNTVAGLTRAFIFTYVGGYGFIKSLTIEGEGSDPFA